MHHLPTVLQHEKADAQQLTSLTAGAARGTTNERQHGKEVHVQEREKVKTRTAMKVIYLATQKERIVWSCSAMALQRREAGEGTSLSCGLNSIMAVSEAARLNSAGVQGWGGISADISTIIFPLLLLILNPCARLNV